MIFVHRKIIRGTANRMRKLSVLGMEPTVFTEKVYMTGLLLKQKKERVPIPLLSILCK